MKAIAKQKSSNEMASCQVELPHNLDSILSDADDNNLKTIPRDEMITQLQDGVFLKQKKVVSPCIIFMVIIKILVAINFNTKNFNTAEILD